MNGDGTPKVDDITPMSDFNKLLLEPTMRVKYVRDQIHKKLTREFAKETDKKLKSKLVEEEPWLSSDPCLRFLAYKFLAIGMKKEIWDIGYRDSCWQASSEYECSREARWLLAHSVPTCVKLSLIDDWRKSNGSDFKRDVFSWKGRSFAVSYDCMNSVATRLGEAYKMKHEEWKGSQFFLEQILLEGQSPEELFDVGTAGFMKELREYVELTHTIGNFAPIPHLEGGPSYNTSIKNALFADAEDSFLKELWRAWNGVAWQIVKEDGEAGDIVYGDEAMPFKDYVRLAQLELYCMEDEIVQGFLQKTDGCFAFLERAEQELISRKDWEEHEDRFERVTSAYEDVLKRVEEREFVPVMFGERKRAKPSSPEELLAYLIGANLRTRARGRIILARYWLSQLKSAN